MSKTTLGRLMAATCLMGAIASAQLPFIVINEVNSDTPGTDTLEFVEFFTQPLSPMAGYTLVFFNGSATGDLAYFAMDLTGTSDANGFYVAGNPLVSPLPSDVFLPGASGALQNGADAVALYFGVTASAFVISGSGATPAALPPVGATLIDAVVYGTDDPSDASLLSALLPGFQQINEGSSGSQAVDQSIGRCADGNPGPLDTSFFVQMNPTPGAPNFCPPVFKIEISQSCPGPITIQVSGAQPFYELYNLIALTCSTPTGSGPFFGINADLAAGQPLVAFTLPVGAEPFHVFADSNGAYTLSVPTSGFCPSPVQIGVEAISIEAIGLGVTRVTSQTTGCVILDL
jgi:hypothetical protein